jgi:2'-5' RNA ligase
MREETWRLFAGVFPPPSLSGRLAEEMEALRKSMGTGRWVSPEKLHLTLCFLGSVEVSSVEDLSKRLAGAVEGCLPADLEVAGLGCYPSLRRPRVLWAGIGGDLASLAKLQAAVQEACLPYVEKVEDRAFSPHLTLARFDRPPRGLARILEASSATSFGAWRVEEVSLVRSHLGTSGHYEVLYLSR